MAGRRLPERHGTVRSAMRQDVLTFGLPALGIFFLGLVVSSRSGYAGLVRILWDLIRHPENVRSLTAPNAAGLALFVVGVTLAIVARVTLGMGYSGTLASREGHQLVTHGVYRLTRNPIYLGVIVACLGVPVYASSLLGFLVMSALIPMFLIRIRMEERLLIEEFGDAYRAYAERTSKLIPFVY